jgi:SsrA-binding protein
MQFLNRKAKIKYSISEKVEAGMVLKGLEVKSIRQGKVDIGNAYAKVFGGEVFLVNANIQTEKGEASTRARKLLLKKNEIVSIMSKIKAKKLTLVPLRIYNKGRIFKVELGLAKAKRIYEKKELLKRRDIERNAEKELRGEKE